ncbi:MAG: hypothetical protein M1503_07715 [Thaumarchaeota archaeon]|nr:hypothetical protein [Nitrososphaerota archaeon]MCL5318129.1 hypothetical protein [Nitrososphaerota archaeon]
MTLKGRRAVPRTPIALLFLGAALLIHGVTIAAFTSIFRFYVDFGIIGQHEFPIVYFPQLSGIIEYSWSTVTLGAILILVSYLVRRLREK